MIAWNEPGSEPRHSNEPGSEPRHGMNEPGSEPIGLSSKWADSQAGTGGKQPLCS